MLQEVEVGGGNRLQPRSQVAYGRDSLEENFREQNGRAPVQIDTVGLHALHQGTEEAEVVQRRLAQGAAVCGGMQVRCIGAQSQMHGERHAVAMRGQNHADAGKSRPLLGQHASGRLAQSDLFPDCSVRHLVEQSACFLGHSEATATQPCRYIFRSMADQRKL